MALTIVLSGLTVNGFLGRAQAAPPVDPSRPLLVQVEGTEPASPAATEPSLDLVQAIEGFEMIPADAMFVLVIPSLERLNEGLASINESLGLGVPMLADLLGTLGSMAGVNEALRNQGPLFMFTSDLNLFQAGTVNIPSFVLAVPVTDFAGFVSGLAATVQGLSPAAEGAPPAAGDLPPIGEGLSTPIDLPGMPLFARSLGNFAVLGTDRTAVDALPAVAPTPLQGLIGQLGSLSLGRSDAVLLVNVERLAPILRPALQAYMPQIMAVYSSQPDVPADVAANTQAMMALYLRMFDSILRDSTRAILGFEASAEALSTTMTLQLREGSFLANLFPSIGSADGLWQYLPERPLLAATAMNLDGLDWVSLVNAFSSALPESAGIMRTLMSESLGLMEGVRNVVQVIYMPDPARLAEGHGLFNAVSVYEISDAPSFLARWQRFSQSIDGLAYPIGPMVNAEGVTVPGQMTYHTMFQADSFEIDGVSVSEWGMRLELPEGLVDPSGMMPLMMNLFGFDGYGGYMAAVGEHVVITTQSDRELLASTLALLASPEAGRDPFASSRLASLTAQPAMEAYIDVGGIANLVLSLVQPSHPEIAFEVPEGMAPVAMFAELSGDALAGRMVVPMSVASFAANLIRQLVPVFQPSAPEPVPAPTAP